MDRAGKMVVGTWKLLYLNINKRKVSKNLSKLVNFCVAILILNMEENTQDFQHIMLHYFMKGKNVTKRQKKDLYDVWRTCCD